MEDTEGCPRYTARVITDVKVAPSPQWLQNRLIAAGVRPINNVVDVTNYVMLELGQPLHAFDLDTLADHHIIVRRARSGEQLETLDGLVRNLTEDHLVIADAQRPVALAGIMGGEDTGVTQATTTVLIESAHFKPQLNRATAKAFSLSSESTYRFQRYVDVNNTLRACDRAIQLIQQLGGGTIAAGPIDIYPMVRQPVRLSLRPERADAILGQHVPAERQVTILRSLGLDAALSDGLINATVPTFRPDLTREIDLVEEVACVWGYDNLEGTLPAIGGLLGRLGEKHAFFNQARNWLVGAGLAEMKTFSLLSPKEVDAVGWLAGHEAPAPVTNAMSEEYSVLRPTLLPCLLREVAYNLNRQQTSVALCELDPVFLPSDGAFPTEEFHAGLVLTGRNYTSEWNLGAFGAADLYELKGLVEELAARLGLLEVTFEAAELPFAVPGAGARVLASGQPLGYLAQVNGATLGFWDIEQPVYVAELNLEAAWELRAVEKPYKRPPAFPKSERDLALIAPTSVPVGALLSTANSAGGELLETSGVFDVFEGASLGEDKRSVALRLVFRHPERTLTDEEVNEAVAAILTALQSAYGVALRG